MEEGKRPVKEVVSTRGEAEISLPEQTVPPTPLVRRLEIRTKVLSVFRSTHSAEGLPTDATRHWRGVWNPEWGRVYGRYDASDRLLSELAPGSNSVSWLTGECWTLCHSKPRTCAHAVRGDEARYPDVPDRLDIFLLLTTQFESIAFAGVKMAAVIRRSPRTVKTLEILDEWLKDPDGGLYRRSRGRAQQRRRWQRTPTSMELDRQTARSALWAIRLEWPGKPRDRERDWPSCLDKIGLDVELFPCSGSR